MLWYGVSGVSFNPTDPSEVMLNTGITAPLLSDHPRSLVAPQVTQTSLGPHPNQTTLSYGGDPSAISQHSQMLYDPNTGDYISQADYMYESYEGYDEDSSGTNSLSSTGQQNSGIHQINHTINHGEEDINSHPKTKKPKVHQHPALKLKTPIAYQKDTDLNAIPIMKEGMAVCEKCGAIGVKHAFYGKERKFCSLACARPPLQNSGIIQKVSFELSKISTKGDSSLLMDYDCEEKFEVKHSTVNDLGTINPSVNSLLGLTGPENEENLRNIKSLNELNSQTEQASDTSIVNSHMDQDTQNYFSLNCHKKINDQNNCKDSEVMSIQNNETSLHQKVRNSSFSLVSSIQAALPRATPTYLPPQAKKIDSFQSYDWDMLYMQTEEFVPAPVKSFKHAPMTECWEQISAGMKVEVSCKDESLMKDAFWVATVISIAGYKANLRFEGFVDDNSKDFWVDLCSDEVHPVGWCATQGKPLIPPKSIQYKYKDWKEFLMRRLTGARTLPTNFQSRVIESQKSRFRPGLNLEVVDKNRIAQMRVATVTEVVGKRLHLRYHGAPPDDNGFWCHEDAAIIHPVGWSREVGHEIVASQSYHEKCMEVSYDPEDAAPDLFITPLKAVISNNSNQNFSVGMKLEAIDPLNLSTICVATVMKILCHNYLMIRIDSYDNDNTCSDWFCYHSASPCIFPAGFCEMNQIFLTPPRGYEGQFSWYSYLTKTEAIAAPPAIFSRDIPNHGFKVGMSLEAADLMDPRLVCVATVKEIKGRLLKIHFDGWEDDFDQWVDCQSPDIYPIGWCKMVGYKLEGPRLAMPVPFLPRKKFRGRGSRKGRPFGGRRGALSRGIENASPLPHIESPTLHPSTSRRGRRPRQRGGKISSLPFQQKSTQVADEYMYEQESSNEMTYCGSESNKFINKGKRGRPRRSLLRISNHSQKSHTQRPTRATRTSLPSYAQSEDEASDETSSGVASLADSEASADCWDVDENSSSFNATIQDVVASNIIENPIEIKNNSDSHEFKLEKLSPHTADTGYRDNASLNFNNISESVLLEEDEGPTFESFLTSTDARIEALPLSDTSYSEFHVSSSLGNAAAEGTLKENILPESNCKDTPMNPLSSVEDGDMSFFINSPESVTSTTSSTSSCFENKPFAPIFSSNQNQLANTFPNLQTPAPSTLTNSVELKSSIKTNVINHFIPRIIDNFNVSRGNEVQPKLWSAQDVASFLKANDCGAYCNNFTAKKIDGPRFLKLGQNEVMELTGMKVGPSLKIHDLIQQLLAILNPAQARYQATLLKRGLTFGKS